MVDCFHFLCWFWMRIYIYIYIYFAFFVMRLLSVNIQFTFFMHDADSLLIYADYRRKLSYTIIYFCVYPHIHIWNLNQPPSPPTHTRRCHLLFCLYCPLFWGVMIECLWAITFSGDRILLLPLMRKILQNSLMLSRSLIAWRHWYISPYNP
jgi:hypothetical protein